MALLERYVDNVYGNDSWDGTSPVYISGTTGPWLTVQKACTTNPGTGNYFHVYLANNTDLNNNVIRPYRRTDSYLFYPRYSGLDLDNPMTFFLNGGWMSSGVQLTETFSKVPGTSYVYRAYVPSISSFSSLYAYGDDSYFSCGGTKAPIKWPLAGAPPLDSMNHCCYFDSSTKYLYVCDWSGNPSVTGLHLEHMQDTHMFRVYLGTPKYHRLTNGIFYGFKNSLVDPSLAEGFFVDRCFIYGDSIYDNTAVLAKNSQLHHCFLRGRSTGSSTNAVVYVKDTGSKVYNNLLWGSTSGVRLANGASADVYNNIFLGQSERAIKFDGTYTLNCGYNAFGSMELDDVYGTVIGKFPESSDVYLFPGTQYGIFDKVWRYDGSNYTDVTTAAANDDGNTFNLMGASSHYIYFGCTEPFNGMLFKLTTAGNYSSMTWQYYAGGSGWQSLSGLAGATSFNATSGIIRFTMPTAWVKTSINGSADLYWIRVKAGTVTTMGVCDYIRINGSVWEYLPYNLDTLDLRSRQIATELKTGYDWGYRGLDLIGNSVKTSRIGPVAQIASHGSSSLCIEIELGA